MIASTVFYYCDNFSVTTDHRHLSSLHRQQQAPRSKKDLVDNMEEKTDYRTGVYITQKNQMETQTINDRIIKNMLTLMIKYLYVCL